jgi:hypothetical protein
MFQQDVQIMGHFFHRGRDEKVSLRFEGQPEQCDKAGTLCASISHDRGGWPDEVIAGAIENITLHLAYHGKAIYEVLRSDTGIELSSFDPDYALDLGFGFLQVAPPAVWKQVEKKFVLLNRNNVWRVEMPQELGGARAYAKILESMSKWPSLGPEFYQAELQLGQIPNDFDFSAYRRADEVRIYQSTKAWGWTGRDWSLNNVTEYYQFYRHLTFNWAQSVLLEHVVADLNRLFKRLDIHTKIIVEGLSSPTEILDIREKMREGKMDFSAAREAIKA